MRHNHPCGILECSEKLTITVCAFRFEQRERPFRGKAELP